MSGTLTVVGGSSPFTLGLAQAIGDQPPWAEGTLRLHGRDRAALEVVTRCAARLVGVGGWRAEAAPDAAAAVAGAAVVLHQNRYGGLAWRGRDEEMVAALGLPPDETLGPAGLAAALRTGEGQRAWAPLLTRSRVLTTTNPLGVSTASFAEAGVDVLGVCELPEVTRRAVEALVGRGRLDGAYSGLNHRGFWHHLRIDGVDGVDGTDELAVLGLVADRLETGARLAGADAATVRDLRAVPDKYHALLRGGTALPRGRAASVGDVRQRALAEAAADPEQMPAALAERDMPWHRLVVLPVLRALAGHPIRVVLTLPRPQGAPVEQQVVLDGTSVTPVPQPEAPEPVVRWCRLLAAHEEAVLAAVRAPSLGSVRDALDADPTVPTGLVDRSASAVLQQFLQWRTSCVSS